MYIAKPQKGFVIPVEYMVNENLFDDNIKYLRNEQRHMVRESNDTENSSDFVGTDKIVPSDVQVVDDIVNDRLFDDDYESYSSEQDNNIVKAVLEKRSNKAESRSGILVFDDVIENNIVIDENKFIQLDRARGNLRKAIEVEIEKVGKIVLDDTESEISSNAEIKSTDVEINDSKFDEREENIVTDESVEGNRQEYTEDVYSDNIKETEAIKNSLENNK